MSEEKKFKGRSLSIVDMNYALYGCADPDSPNISPEMRKKMYELCSPKADGFKGMPIIASTSEDNNPKIQFTDPFPKSGEGFKVVWDEAGIMPVSAEYTHYWEMIKKPASSEEFFDEVQKAAKYFNADIYDNCAKCGNLTKNGICKECSK